MTKRGLGAVYLRGSIYWLRYWHRGQLSRESSGSDSEASATKLLKERIKQIGRPQGFLGPAEERVTFEDLAALVQTDHAINDRRSADKLPCRLAHLRAAFAHDRAVDITTDLICTYIANRQQSGAANATINRELAALKGAFTLAVQAKRLSQIPHIPMLEENNARQGFVDHAEYRALRDELPEHLRDSITFLYLTGWRLSEMESLEWRDIDLAAQVVRLRPENSKNKDSREIPSDRFPELGELLAHARANRRLDCRFVFHQNGQPLGDFRKSWATACEKAGLTKTLVHDLRSTAVRNFVRAGVSERVAMERTGHKTRTVFERYNIVSDNDKQAAAQKLAAYLDAQPTAPAVLPLTSSECAS